MHSDFTPLSLYHPSRWYQPLFTVGVWLSLAILLVFWVYPLLGAFWWSVHDTTHTLTSPRFVGLTHYWRCVHDPLFWQMMGRTALFSFSTVCAMTLGGTFLGLILGPQFQGVGLLRTLLYIPVIISFVVTGLLWKVLLAETGVFNQFLGLLGLPVIGWLTTPQWAMVGVLLAVIWKGLGYYATFIVAQYQSMNESLVEAAYLEGAKPWQVTWFVVLPQLKQGISLITLIATVGALKTFAEIYLMTGGGPARATETLAVSLFTEGFGYMALGKASTLGILLMVSVLLCAWIQSWVTRSRDT
ncbi:MAG: carbohydrate ABC transporter permease [Vampirovibrionales bacterium]